MVVDAYASLRHYHDHLAPIWERLPAGVRGTFWSPSRSQQWGRALDRTRDQGALTLVASALDGAQLGDTPLVYVEHGAGQTYTGTRSGSYAGGPGHGGVRLFVAPNRHVAGRWSDAYPGVPVAVVGCPKLDRWHLEQQDQHHDDQEDCDDHAGGHDRDGTRPLRVAVTFHWDCGLCPETRSAWRHYDRALPRLCRDHRWEVWGHGHPRLWPTIRQRWTQLGVRLVPQLGDVLDGADLLVADNTSALYEFASTGRPVVCVNQPGYRRDVEHGLRFWSHPPGVQCDEPGDLADLIAFAATDPPGVQAIRTAAVARAYDAVDGYATARAVAAILEVHDG